MESRREAHLAAGQPNQFRHFRQSTTRQGPALLKMADRGFSLFGGLVRQRVAHAEFRSDIIDNERCTLVQTIFALVGEVRNAMIPCDNVPERVQLWLPSIRGA